jgi:hypothetical protein
MKHIFRSVFGVAVFAAALHGQSLQSVVKTVAETSKWSPAGDPSDKLPAKVKTVALRYGMDSVSIQEWKGPSGTARLTLYQMIDSAAAYGLFGWLRSSERQTSANVAVGADSFQSPNGATFWQSNYVASVSGPNAAVNELAQTISQNILGASRKPPVSEWLPPNGLVAGSEKYVISPDDLGSGVGIDPGALGFEDSVEIAMASYNIDGQPAQLALMLYPTQQIAKKYGDGLPSEGPRGPVFTKRVSSLVAVVSGVKDASVADKVFANVNYETKVTWNEPRPGLGLGTVIVTIFTFIGVALLFTVVVGISFGGMRIFMKARYPNRVFDRPEDMEIIQLKLAQGVSRRELHD